MAPSGDLKQRYSDLPDVPPSTGVGPIAPLQTWSPTINESNDRIILSPRALEVLSVINSIFDAQSLPHDPAMVRPA